jgi:hypothetical protein
MEVGMSRAAKKYLRDRINVKERKAPRTCLGQRARTGGI